MASGRIIVLKGTPLVKEGKANAIIKPGHHLLLSATAGDVGLGAVPVVGTQSRKAVAVEADVVGNTAADAYADNDQVKYVTPHTGVELLVRAAVGLTWVIGAPMYAVAAGQFSDVPAGTADQPFGFALSAVTTSGADELVPIEVS